MPKVVITNEKKEIEIPAGVNLRKAARDAGIQLYAGLTRYLNCRGLGSCGTCAVLVKKGMDSLTDKTLMEKLTLGRSLKVIGHEHEMRLACQCTVKGDCTIETQPGLQLSPETDPKGKYFWETAWPNK